MTEYFVSKPTQDYFAYLDNKKPDNVNNPKHYTSHPSGVECITIAEHYKFSIGNAIKYLWRWRHKNGVEDLKKAAWYIQRMIDEFDAK